MIETTPPFTVPDEVLSDHVFHSNWIEGYPPDQYPKESRLYRQHMDAAQRVVKTGTWDPQELHFILLSGTGMLSPADIGIFRNAQVYIGDFYPPSPGIHLTTHIQRWKEYVVKGPPDEDRIEWWCWQVHDWYETIHPFVDGNGRTGRLILNSMRLRYGLPWLVVHQGHEQQRYYEHIRRWQNGPNWSCNNNHIEWCLQ